MAHMVARIQIHGQLMAVLPTNGSTTLGLPRRHAIDQRAVAMLDMVAVSTLILGTGLWTLSTDTPILQVITKAISRPLRFQHHRVRRVGALANATNVTGRIQLMRVLISRRPEKTIRMHGQITGPNAPKKWVRPGAMSYCVEDSVCSSLAMAVAFFTRSASA